MTKAKCDINVSWVGFTIVILFLIASLFHVRRLWGINLPVFHSDFTIYILCGLVIIATIPPVTIKMMAGLNHLQTLIRKRKKFRVALFVSFAAVFFALSLYFQSVTTFLGDGHLRTNQLTFDQWFLPTEFLDFLLHAAFFDFILKPLDYSPMQCYQIFSSLCGLVFIVGLWRLANRLFEKSATAAFLLLVSSGVTAFFFGYIESYSLITCFAPFVILSGINTVENKSGIALS